MLKYSWDLKDEHGKSRCVVTWTDRRTGSLLTFDIPAEHASNEPESEMDSRIKGRAISLAKAFLADQDPYHAARFMLSPE